MRKRSTKSKKYKANTNSLFRTADVEKLFRIYAVLRRLTSGTNIPIQFLESRWGRKVFEELQKNILEHQKTTGLKVNPTIFIRTQFLVYGKDTYPTHLIAYNSFDIYRQYREQCVFKVSDDDSTFKTQMVTLDYLCRIRSESRQEAISKLQHEGLFTEAFIKYVRDL